MENKNKGKKVKEKDRYKCKRQECREKDKMIKVPQIFDILKYADYSL